MTKQTMRGKFVWHDLLTSDPAAAQRFYGALFGWRFETNPGYTQFECAGRASGGIVKLDPSWNAPPHWNGYVEVDDLDAALARVPRLGGKVHMGATVVPGTGRFGLVADPLGATLAVWQYTLAKEPWTAAPVASQFCWDELLSRDPSKVSAFYSELFGWRADSVDMGPMGTYWLWKVDGADVAGMMTLPQDAPAPSHWLAYVAVADVDASQRQATALGARTYVPPSDIPGIGRFSVLADPQGATFALYRKA